MSVVAITLTAYVLSLGDNVQNANIQRTALSETNLNISFQEHVIPFSHRNWKVINGSVCSNHDRNTPMYSDCTVRAKSLFQQICTALTNETSPYWFHQKYKTMYCDAAVNYSPLVATISYGTDTQISLLEKKCNQLILKAMVSGTKEDNEQKKAICEKVK